MRIFVLNVEHEWFSLDKSYNLFTACISDELPSMKRFGFGIHGGRAQTISLRSNLKVRSQALGLDNEPRQIFLLKRSYKYGFSSLVVALIIQNTKSCFELMKIPDGGQFLTMQ